MKKTVSLFLSLVMVLGLITIPATAETNGVLTKEPFSRCNNYGILPLNFLKLF